MVSFFQTYDMNALSMGYAVVINIMNFDHEPQKQRIGSEFDVDRICKTLQKSLGFKLYEGKPHIDLTSTEIKMLLKKFAKDPVQKLASCSAVVIMTHGLNQGQILGRNNFTVSLSREIMPLFANGNAPDLKGKPKLFFIEACRYAKI